jgi:hypothetical protein
MNDDRLAELLRQTDALMPPPICSGDVAERIHAAVRRQQAIRRTAGAMATGLVLMAGTYLLATRSDRQADPALVTESTPDAQAELAELRAELAALRADIDVAAEQVRALRKAHAPQLAGSGTRSDRFEPTPAERLDAELDKTAFIMIHRGDLMYRTYGLVEPAIESYRRAIKLFPDSRWAGVARDRLNEIEKPKGDQL